MSPVREKFRILTDRIYLRTLDKTLQWETEPFGQGLICDMGDYRLRLSNFKNSENEPMEQVEITNSDEQVIDSFTDADINGEVPSVSEHMNYYQLMVEIRQLARRQANGADAALDDIINKLNK